VETARNMALKLVMMGSMTGRDALLVAKALIHYILALLALIQQQLFVFPNVETAK